MPYCQLVPTKIPNITLEVTSKDFLETEIN